MDPVTAAVHTLLNVDQKRIREHGPNSGVPNDSYKSSYAEALTACAKEVGLTLESAQVFALETRLADSIMLMENTLRPLLKNTIQIMNNVTNEDNSADRKFTFSHFPAVPVDEIFDDVMNPTPTTSTTPREVSAGTAATMNGGHSMQQQIQSPGISVLVDLRTANTTNQPGPVGADAIYDSLVVTRKMSVGLLSRTESELHENYPDNEHEEAIEQLKTQLENVCAERDLAEKENESLHELLNTQITQFQQWVQRATDMQMEVTTYLDHLSPHLHRDSVMMTTIPATRPSTVDTTLAKCVSGEGSDNNVSHFQSICEVFYRGKPKQFLWDALESCLLNFYDGKAGLEVFRDDFVEALGWIASQEKDVAIEKLNAKRLLNMSAIKLYHAQCKEMNLKPNSGVIRLLASSTSSFETLDLSANYIGDQGLLALLPVLNTMRTLKHLSLRDNGLRNGSVVELLKMLRTHPGLETLDLSHNKITRVAGREVLTLFSINRRIQFVNVEETRLDEPLKLRIQKMGQPANVTAKNKAE
eukprot:PhF_6_TR632/c0_g1_i2/m.862